jgi:hypothetical protein
MTFAEGFMDTAQLRESVVSHAKDLNYTPRSARSAVATVNVSFTATGENQPYIVQKGSSFSTLIKNKSFIFTVPETIVVASVNNSFNFTTDIYEGTYLKDAYIYKTPTTSAVPRFQISNKNVDTSSIDVKVHEDGAVLGKAYSLKQTLLDLTPTSEVFFLQARENGYFEILFGDNNLGKAPKEGSTVIIEYRVTSGDTANGSRVFSINFSPTGEFSELTSQITVETIDAAHAGAPLESIESIRYTAPRHFQAQERMVVPADYATLLKQTFPEIAAVAAYGGEDVQPTPQYGRVYVAIDISNVDGIPDSKREEYERFIRRRSQMIPVIVEPEFSYVFVDTLIRYNQNVTVNTPSVMRTIVLNAISEWNDENLGDFHEEFRYSPFLRMLDNADVSIISNITTIKVYKKFSPTFAKIVDVTLEFGFPLNDGFGRVDLSYPVTELTAVTSSEFTFAGVTNARIHDDGNGNLRVVNRVGDTFFTIITDAGTVDYKTGKIHMANFVIDSYLGNSINLFVVPKDPDIKFPPRTIAAIEAGETKVTTEPLQL